EQSQGETVCSNAAASVENSRGTDACSPTRAERCVTLVRNAMDTCQRIDRITAAMKRNMHQPGGSVASVVYFRGVKRYVNNLNGTKRKDYFANDEEGERSSKQSQQQQQQQQQRQRKKTDEHTPKQLPEGETYIAPTKKKVHIRREIGEGVPFTTRGGFDSTENANTQHQHPRAP
ncbi:unnamed protein product, partial [Sphacelaria rigidula]